MLLSSIRNSLSAKVSLALAALTVTLTAAVGYTIIAREGAALEQQVIVKAKLSAGLGAQAYGKLLEDAIDHGYMSVQDVFDHDYQEIKGYDWGDQPKYHTKYDFYTDREVTGFLDRFLTSEDIVSAIGTDINGYIPTHNTRWQHPLTGDRAKDLEGNRTKRIASYDVALKAAHSEAPSLVQPYKRDTGAMMWDVSSPVFVKGKHWGCFRVVVSVDAIDRQRAGLMRILIAMFAGFAALITASMFAMIRRAMVPLVQLTKLADELSLGSHLERPIRTESHDEVGQMAKSLDRLRASLQAAMARLGE